MSVQQAFTLGTLGAALGVRGAPIHTQGDEGARGALPVEMRMLSSVWLPRIIVIIGGVLVFVGVVAILFSIRSRRKRRQMEMPELPQPVDEEEEEPEPVGMMLSVSTKRRIAQELEAEKKRKRKAQVSEKEKERERNMLIAKREQVQKAIKEKIEMGVTNGVSECSTEGDMVSVEAGGLAEREILGDALGGNGSERNTASIGVRQVSEDRIEPNI